MVIYYLLDIFVNISRTYSRSKLMFIYNMNTQPHLTKVSITFLLHFPYNSIPIEISLRLINANTNHRFTTKYE